MFSQVPATYELVNHILTLGLDTIWRRRAVRLAATAGGEGWADLCTGTGETASYLRRRAPADTTVYAIDLSRPMLAEAREKPEAGRIQFLNSEAMTLPLPDASLDLITMSFATRNINRSKTILTNTFAEYYRVLRPGGMFVNLETSQPPFGPVRRSRDLYVKLFVEAIGARVSGSRLAYAYLAQTIPKFYPAEELAEILRSAGFEAISYEHQLLGVVAIHAAIKA